ncbi:cGMP-dependent protein kinase 1-like [Ciona intestinalis]
MPCCCFFWPCRKKQGSDLESAGRFELNSGTTNGGFTPTEGNETVLASKNGNDPKSIQKLEHELKVQKETKQEVLLELENVRRKLETAKEERERMQKVIQKLQKELQSANNQLEKKSNYLQSIQKITDVEGKETHKRRQAVRGHHATVPPKLQKTEKSQPLKDLLKRAIQQNDVLCNLNEDQIDAMIDHMQRALPSSNVFITEGTIGDRLYVLETGEVEVTQNSKYLCTLTAGSVFGEIAIMYNTKRTATVTATSATKVWMLEQSVFHYIMKNVADTQRQKVMEVVKKIPVIRKIRTRKQQVEVVDALVEETFNKGDYIIRQGDMGSSFYILVEGEVDVTSTGNVSSDGDSKGEHFIRSFGAVSYFGEKGLRNNSGTREANVVAKSKVVKCLSLDKSVFSRHIGELADKDWDAIDERASSKISNRPSNKPSNKPSKMKYRKSTDGNLQPESRRGSHISTLSTFVELPTKRQNPEYENIQPSDLECVGILGVGGFGKVELVRFKHERKDKSYALKCLNKADYEGTTQENYHMSEIDIMSTVRCPFIVELYHSFENERYNYMLMEACLGGELWTKLSLRGKFEDREARFYAACVIEALDYLHGHGIAYRDIKPENLVLDQHGYVKLIDLGLAKKMETHSEKTFSVSGTAAYMAPEVLLHTGHDMSVDYWALGILIFEFLAGYPPFNDKDPGKMHLQIAKGIERVRWPEQIRSNAKHIITSLCRLKAADRLGNSWRGVKEIRDHMWFGAFNWNDLRNWKLKAPIIPFVDGPFYLGNFDNFDEDFEDTKDKKDKKKK